jgi:biopolymer transport protein ExbD
VVVAIAGGEIMVSGEHAASMKEALQSDGLEIAPLAARLQAIQAQQDEIARLRGGKSEGARTVTIQGDRDIEFKVLQKVMYTLGQNGYENISLAVLQKS